MMIYFWWFTHNQLLLYISIKDVMDYLY